jgi:transketolase
MLQYALLHLYGYALSIDDLKSFRVSRKSYCML